MASDPPAPRARQRWLAGELEAEVALPVEVAAPCSGSMPACSPLSRLQRTTRGGAAIVMTEKTTAALLVDVPIHRWALEQRAHLVPAGARHFVSASHEATAR
jgi:hypothetical protein